MPAGHEFIVGHIYFWVVFIYFESISKILFKIKCQSCSISADASNLRDLIFCETLLPAALSSVHPSFASSILHITVLCHSLFMYISDSCSHFPLVRLQLKAKWFHIFFFSFFFFQILFVCWLVCCLKNECTLKINMCLYCPVKEKNLFNPSWVTDLSEIVTAEYRG